MQCGTDWPGVSGEYRGVNRPCYLVASSYLVKVHAIFANLERPANMLASAKGSCQYVYHGKLSKNYGSLYSTK